MSEESDREATIRVGDGAYPIGEAARRTGVSRGLLRLWERERLISPRRTAGGHRLYTGDDLRRLREIARLRATEQLNAAAIRRELGAADGDTVTEAASGPALGARLRGMRRARGWSLAAVAERAELSVSFLSAVERGQASPSVGTLFKLADAYGTTVPGLDPAYHPDERPVVRPAERPRYVAGGGRVVIEDLIAHPEALEAQRIEVQSGGGSEEAYAHPGEEFVYVLAGELAFAIGDGEEPYRLRAGDSLSFRSTRPHRWWNDGEEPATLLWINAPEVAPEAGSDARRPVGRRAPRRSIGSRQT